MSKPENTSGLIGWEKVPLKKERWDASYDRGTS